MIESLKIKKHLKELVRRVEKGGVLDDTLREMIADTDDAHLLSLLKILNVEKNKINPDKDMYHRLLHKMSVARKPAVRYFDGESGKGRRILNFNNFFMTLNAKAITATCLVVVLGGVFAYWQLSPTFKNQTAKTDEVKQEQEDLSGYAPATVVAVKDVSTVSDSIVDDIISDDNILLEEETDIILANAEDQAFNELEQLYDAYEL